MKFQPLLIFFLALAATPHGARAEAASSFPEKYQGVVCWEQYAGKDGSENRPASAGCPDWGRKLGKSLTVEGLAQNAKLGAIVLVDGEALYLQGKDAWETEVLNRKVRVTGVLRQISQPVAVQEKGEWSAGVTAPGTAYQLEKFRWKLIDDKPQ